MYEKFGEKSKNWVAYLSSMIRRNDEKCVDRMLAQISVARCSEASFHLIFTAKAFQCRPSLITNRSHYSVYSVEFPLFFFIHVHSFMFIHEFGWFTEIHESGALIFLRFIGALINFGSIRTV